MIQDYLKDLNIELNPHSSCDKDKFIFTATLDLIIEKCKDKDRRYELLLYSDFINKKCIKVYNYNDTSHNIIIKDNNKIPLMAQIGVIDFFDINDKFVIVDVKSNVNPFSYNDIAIKYYKGE